jgi:hypothetical protein
VSSNEASELRIAIARVIERWQCERLALDTDTSGARKNLQALDARFCALQNGCEERWEELARLQAEIIAALRSQLTRNAQLEMLSEHVEDLKRVITPSEQSVSRETIHRETEP